MLLWSCFWFLIVSFPFLHTKAVESFKSQWKGTGLTPGLMSWCSEYLYVSLTWTAGILEISCSLRGKKKLLCFALAEAGPDASSNVSSPKPSIRKFQASCGMGRYKKLLLRLEALAPLCSSESTTPRPSRAPCLAAPQKCHRRPKRDATSSELGSFLLRGKQAYAGLRANHSLFRFCFFLQPTFPHAWTRRRHGQVAHRKQALLGCKPT